MEPEGQRTGVLGTGAGQRPGKGFSGGNPVSERASPEELGDGQRVPSSLAGEHLIEYTVILIVDNLPPPLKLRTSFIRTSPFIYSDMSYSLLIVLYVVPFPFVIPHIVPDVHVRITSCLLCCLQDEGDYLCVKVLRHSKSKKTMVSQNFVRAGCDSRYSVILTFKRRCGRTYMGVDETT